MSLQIKKLDLHIHSPRSYDFQDQTITAEQIVDHAISIGLDGLAITDHNTVDFIDTIKAAAEKKNFTVFPGIEVSCGGSLHGSIHIIALFDPSKTKDDLQKILGKLDIKGKDENSLTSKSVSDVVNIIRESGGLSVLAHANSTHGALSDIRGNPRTDLVQNKNLCAVEVTSANFRKKKGERIIDYLNGEDPPYKRKLAVYKSSDNRSSDDKGHCLASIGGSFTYFKMGELTIESLRQCFEDPDSRIIQDYETDKINSVHPRIKSISITGGFLDGQKIDFHPGMNSIIGGTGTGKSLVIEFLRFAFNKKPHNILFSDHKEKLNNQLRINGEIKVSFKDAAGEKYELSRKYESSRDPYTSSTQCVNKTTGKNFKGDVSSIFPLLIYSQNEILEITRDADAQLKLLDNFRDFETYQNKIRDIAQGLSNLDFQLFQAIQDSLSLSEWRRQSQNIEEKLKKFEKKIVGSGSKGVFKKYIKLSKQKANLEAKIEEYDALLNRVNEVIDEFTKNTPLRKKTPKDILDIIGADISDSYINVVSSLKKSREVVKNSKKKSQLDLATWERTNNYDEVEKKYKGEIKLKKREESLETARRDLMDEEKELNPKITKAEQASNQYMNLRSERSGLLTKFEATKSAYFSERSRQAELITNKSGGKLKIVVQAGNNKEIYIQMLKKLKIGSHAEKTEIEEIANTVSPISLVEMVLDKDIKKLSKLTKTTEQMSENIIKELADPTNLLKTLSLQYQGYPEDRVEISYQKKDGNYYPLFTLSMGQKADALIMIALGDGVMPVVIDQPEDALDIPSIWADICSRLRISKNGRQFIFTTHNSSISVSSDSDQYIVLEADGLKGWLAHAGSIDEKLTKDKVVGHLEGGYKSYDLKRKKYGL